LACSKRFSRFWARANSSGNPVARAMAFSDFDRVGSFWEGYVFWVADGLLMF
jgi:hypothetical protein